MFMCAGIKFISFYLQKLITWLKVIAYYCPLKVLFCIYFELQYIGSAANTH